jgi:hypothetical protein
MRGPLVSALLLFAARCQELLLERGLEADHATVWRWVQYGGPELEHGLRVTSSRRTSPSASMKPMFGSRAAGTPFIERSILRVPPSTFYCRCHATARPRNACFAKALSDPSHPQPRVIHTYQARLCVPAIAAMKEEGTLGWRRRHRPVQYSNNMLEQDHPCDQATSESQVRLSEVQGPDDGRHPDLEEHPGIRQGQQKNRATLAEIMDKMGWQKAYCPRVHGWRDEEGRIHR